MPSYSLSTQPTQIATLSSEQELSIRVLGAGTVLLAQSLADCQNGVGLSIVASDNIQKQKFQGEVWATCDDPLTKIQVVFPQSGDSPVNSYQSVQSKNSIVKLLIDGARKQQTQTCDRKLSLKSAFSKLIGRNIGYVFLLALINPYLSSQDVQVPVSANPFVKISTNLIWGQSGIGGFNNIFVLNTSAANASDTCISVINNNTTNQHVFSLSAFGSADVSTKSYTGNTSRFVQLQVTPTVGITTTSYVVNNGASIYIHVFSQGLPHIALVFSSSTAQAGSPDTADIYAVVGCNALVGQNELGASIPVFCSQHKVVNIPISSTVGLVNLVNKQRIYVCEFTSIVPDGSVTPDAVFIEDLNNGCAGLIDTDFLASGSNSGSAGGYIFKTLPSDALCAKNNSAANAIKVAISYSQF